MIISIVTQNLSARDRVGVQRVTHLHNLTERRQRGRETVCFQSRGMYVNLRLLDEQWSTGWG